MQRFERIYEQHREAVRAYVRRRAPQSWVEDVVEDVFVVCLRRIEDVPREPLPWLYAVARKTLANERRRQARVAPADPGVAYEPEPLGDAGLAAAFASLSDDDREVLRLVAWEGLSPRESADVLGCSGVAARVRYHRAKTRLRAALDAAASFRRPEPKEVTE
jgi:RNA polymerase sigma-70 factor (ECF subfamily)